MSDISINGNNFILQTKGDLSVERSNNTAIKGNYDDDIAIKDKKGKINIISADEIEIKSGNTKVGFPKVGDQIKLFDETGGTRVEGEVIKVDDEDDHQTLMKGYVSIWDRARNDFKETLEGVNPSFKLEGFSFSKVDTYKEKSFDVGVKIGGAGGSAVVSGAYTFYSDQDTDMAEYYPFGNKILNEPHSITPILAAQGVINLGPSEASIGFKENMGVEFNRPFKNDFSASLATFINVGAGKGGDIFIESGLGVEGRYEVDKNTTVSFMPFYSARATFTDEGKEKTKGGGIQIGANFKF